MAESSSKEKKPLVGFFNLFYNFGETCRSISIAKQYKELGGEVVFFSHGGEYEYMAKDIDCEVIRVNPIYTKEIIDFFWACSRLETFKNPFSEKFLIEHVEEEIKTFKETDVKLIVSTNNFPCGISARVVGIPLIFVTPKTIEHYTVYPEDAEFFFTRLVPKSLKLKILNWYAPRTKIWVKPFIKVAKKYNIHTYKTADDITKGDYTFYVDSIEFLDIDKSSVKANELYVGHSFIDEFYAKTLDEAEVSKEEQILKNHIDREGRSILLTLGSSGTKEIFLKILDTLNKTEYNVIAVYTSVLDKNDLPDVNENILLKKFVPSMIKLNKMVDLAIINGGKATVYTAAYAGKPVIGFPMQFEQHINLELLLKHRVGHLESRKYFEDERFLKKISDIFTNYDFYLKNAQTLARTLPKPEGDKIAAEKIIEIL